MYQTRNPPLGHTAEARALKMRALRAEAGRKAKADMEAARERLRKKEALLRRMKEDRALEEEMLRRLVASGGNALEKVAAAVAKEEDEREALSMLPRFRACDVCYDMRKDAALRKYPDAALKLCSKCHARAAKIAAAEVRRARAPPSGKGERRSGNGKLPFEPASHLARGRDELENALRDADASVALAEDAKTRAAALHKASQLRQAMTHK